MKQKIKDVVWVWFGLAPRGSLREFICLQLLLWCDGCRLIQKLEYYRWYFLRYPVTGL